MKDPEQNRVSQNEEESSAGNCDKPSLSSRIKTFRAIVKPKFLAFVRKLSVKTFTSSLGFLLALAVGWSHGSSSNFASTSMQMPLLVASLWASSLPFFYSYYRLSNPEGERALKSAEKENRLTISGIVFSWAMAIGWNADQMRITLISGIVFLATMIFAVCAGLSVSLFILLVLCWLIYPLFALGLTLCSDATRRQKIRFRLILPVLAATAIPFCAGNYLAEAEPSSLLSIVALFAYIVVMFVTSRKDNEWPFFRVSLLLIALVPLVALVALAELPLLVSFVALSACIVAAYGLRKKDDAKWYFFGTSLLLIVPVALGVVFSQYVPPIVGDMSAILFKSILIAAVSAAFESWRIAELEEARRDEEKRGDYFLSSSFALVVVVLLFPLIFLAGGFSNRAYYGVPVLLLFFMAIWCVWFERLSGNWKWIKTLVGFVFLLALLCDFPIVGALIPADATLMYSSQSLESLAMAMALFGLYWSQVIGPINKAKHERSSSALQAGKLFLRERINYFRFIGCLSSIVISVLYVVRNLLGISAIGAADVSDLMGSYMFLALICAVFDFVLVFFVSEDTLKGVKKDDNLMKGVER